jgi:integrase
MNTKVNTNLARSARSGSRDFAQKERMNEQSIPEISSHVMDSFLCMENAEEQNISTSLITVNERRMSETPLELSRMEEESELPPIFEQDSATTHITDFISTAEEKAKPQLRPTVLGRNQGFVKLPILKGETLVSRSSLCEFCKVGQHHKCVGNRSRPQCCCGGDRSPKAFLGIQIDNRNWTSSYKSVDTVLNYLQTRQSNSEATKEKFCYILRIFSILAGKTPDELVGMDKCTIEEYVEKFCNDIMKRTNWGRTANHSLVLLKLFFRENGFRREVGREIFVRPFHVTARSSKRGEYIPTPQEAVAMANACGMGTRDSAIILILAFSGLRNSTLRAILYREIRDELEAGKENILIKVHEDMKKIVPNAAKGRLSYHVFTTKLATEALRRHVIDRTQKLGKIPEEAPLFATNYTGVSDRVKRSCTILTARELELIVKDAARKAGVKDWKLVTPHKLRKTFESFLRNQPHESRLDVKDQEFFMGHLLPGSQDNYYDKTKIEQMREKFSRLVIDRDPTIQTMFEMAKLHGIDVDLAGQELADRIGHNPNRLEELDFLRKKIQEKIEEKSKPPKMIQAIVSIDELQNRMNEGWRVVLTLPGDKIVVEKQVIAEGDTN